MALRDLPVVDIYLGHDYCDLKGLRGEYPREPAPVELAGELDAIRLKCLELYKLGDPEFALHHDGVLYRTTMLPETSSHPVFILSRASDDILPIDKLGLPRHIKDIALAPETRGLILIAGEMGSGKTTTATSLLAARLNRTGELGLAIEDPIETNLNGPHGNGRCIQIQASRREGGYREFLTRAMRSRVETIYLAELRDEGSTEQAVQLSNTGHLVITTTHAGNVKQALERVVSWARALHDPAGLLADGLALVVHQTLTRVEGRQPHLKVRALAFTGAAFQDDASALRKHIRDGRISQLETHIDQQAHGSTWRTT